MTHRLAVAIVLSAGCVVAATQDQTAPTVSVYADASVSAADAPAGLALTVDGVAVPIAHVARGPHPISAVVLLDASSSVAASQISNAARTIAGVAARGDAIRLATFARKILLSKTLVTDDATSVRAWREVSQQGGPSPLWDAMHESLRAVAQARGVRSVVVFTDGMATGNDRSLSEVDELASSEGVIISAVGVGDKALSFSTSMVAVGRNDGLRRLTESTGGNYYELEKKSDTAVYRLAWMLEQTRKRVRIDFVPSARDGAVHRIVLTHKGKPVRTVSRIRF